MVPGYKPGPPALPPPRLSLCPRGAVARRVLAAATFNLQEGEPWLRPTAPQTTPPTAGRRSRAERDLPWETAPRIARVRVPWLAASSRQPRSHSRSGGTWLRPPSFANPALRSPLRRAKQRASEGKHRRKPRHPRREGARHPPSPGGFGGQVHVCPCVHATQRTDSLAGALPPSPGGYGGPAHDARRGRTRPPPLKLWRASPAAFARPLSKPRTPNWG